MTKPRCADCRFWNVTGDQVGDCHREPPRPTTNGDHRARWPWVEANSWCGEFAESDAARMARPRPPFPGAPVVLPMTLHGGLPSITCDLLGHSWRRTEGGGTVEFAPLARRECRRCKRLELVE